MPRLEKIITHGNRGLHAHEDNSTIRCADGWEVSVVAGPGTYCTPRPMRYDDPYPGPYTAVEILAEGEVEPRGWVPVDEVRALIASHGGEA